MSSPAYLIPMLSSVLVISASVYSSKRLAPSSVKMTYGAGVYNVSAISFSVSSTDWATHPAMGTVLALVECPQAQGADVAGDVVAGGDRVVADGVRADEADLDIAVVALFLCVVLDFEIRELAGRCRFWLVVCGLGGRVLCARVMGSSSAPPPAAAPPTSSASASVAVSSGSGGRVIWRSGGRCRTSRSHHRVLLLGRRGGRRKGCMGLLLDGFDSSFVSKMSQSRQ